MLAPWHTIYALLIVYIILSAALDSVGASDFDAASPADGLHSSHSNRTLFANRPRRLLQTDSKIVGSQPDVYPLFGGWDYNVLVQSYTVAGAAASFQYYCTGTLVSSTRVLTSGDCCRYLTSAQGAFRQIDIIVGARKLAPYDVTNIGVGFSLTDPYDWYTDHDRNRNSVYTYAYKCWVPEHFYTPKPTEPKRWDLNFCVVNLLADNPDFNNPDILQRLEDHPRADYDKWGPDVRPLAPGSTAFMYGWGDTSPDARTPPVPANTLKGMSVTTVDCGSIELSPRIVTRENINPAGTWAGSQDNHFICVAPSAKGGPSKGDDGGNRRPCSL